MFRVTIWISFLCLTVAFATHTDQKKDLPNRDYSPEACNKDNCLRALLSPHHSSEAVSFCRYYITPTLTYTINTTRTVTSTFDNNIFQPFTTVTGSGTDTLTTYTTITSTHSHTLPPPPLPLTTTTAQTISVIPREYPVYPSIPAFLSACSSSSGKLSSACSCLMSATSIEHTVDVTVVALGGTTTLPAITVTEESTVTELLTTTFTLFEP